MLSQYVLIILWIGIVALYDRGGMLMRIEYENGVEQYRYPFRTAILIFLPIILIAGFKTGNMGGDILSYISKLRDAPAALEDIPLYISGINKDKGFYVLTAVLKSVVGNNFTNYFMIIAFIQGICVVQAFRKYSINYILSVFLFVASTDYMVWMFNGLRQFMAVAIIFAATPLFLKKKYIKAICIILLASTFHQSALIMIPIIFICQGEAFNWKTMLMIIAAVLAVVFVGEFTSLLDDSLAGTQYVNVVSDMANSKDDGTNPLRVLVYSMPTILAVLNYKVIKDEPDSTLHFCTNMSIVSTAIYFVSMFTSGIFIGRLPIYASLYGYILLPWEIEYLFGSNRKTVYGALIVGYLAFYYFQMSLTWGYF